MRVSEAYGTLGSPQKRQRYDRDQLPSQETASPNRQSPYSNTASPVGARPASGLSRRRTHFRGPPPSFYRNGGWGFHGEERQAHADGIAKAHAQAAAAGQAGGMGHGQGQAGFSNDVPHFDQEAHFRTQEQQEQRRRQRLRAQSTAYEDGGSIIFRFLVMSGIIALACSPIVFLGGPNLVPFRERRDHT